MPNCGNPRVRVIVSIACFVIFGVFAPGAMPGHARDASSLTTCPAGTSAVLTPTLTVVKGGTATATFYIAAHCTNFRVSLASYVAPAGNFALPQELIDSKTVVTTTTGSKSAKITLTTNVSPCFYQVDLVIGPVINPLTD